MDKDQKGDVSGRGLGGGYKVPFPGKMSEYLQEEIDTVTDVMKNSDVLTQGAHMQEFQKSFEEYTGAKHAFAVDNASNALVLAMALCRIEKGDEVIVPAYTFCSTAIAAGMHGAKIVWADMDNDSWNVSPQDIERKITDRTKVIIAVHLLGMPADMPAIMKIAQKHGLKVIEDCAQAPGAMIGGQMCGTFGDFGCFSFQTAKNISTLGEGGMLTVKSDEDAALVPGLRFVGAKAFPEDRERYWVPAMSTVDLDIEGQWPYNFCLGEAQCALGSVMLKRLGDVNEKLIEQGMKIRQALADIPEITFSKIPQGYKHVHHQFVMHFEGTEGKDRNDLMDILVNDYKMRCIVQYWPLYNFPLFAKMGFGGHDCPVLDEWWDNSFSLPWWCGMDDETIDYMVGAVKEAVERLKKQPREK